MSCISEAGPVRLRLAAPGGRSPEFVQVSTAAAITLGAMPGRMHRCGSTQCLNVLLTYPEGCRANCSYCGLARHRDETVGYADRNFIRVEWPTLRLDDVLARMAVEGAGAFERMCISMITHPRAEADTLEILKRWVAVSAVPVSILSNPTTMGRADVAALHKAGADIFTVALDAATPDLFAAHRGRGRRSPHNWAKYWEVFGYAREIFGAGRIGMHIIVGLGETDRDVLEVCAGLHAVGGHSHLFCFFPERGSLMADVPAPPRARWRRVQLARYLIEYGGVPLAAMRFDAAGGLVDFGVGEAELAAVVATGVPFRTSGCPGAGRPDVSACNRPYGDSPPSDIASYPYAPEEDDMERIRSQLASG